MDTTLPTSAECAAHYFINSLMTRAYKKRFDDLPECAASLSSLIDDRAVLLACHAHLQKMEETGELAAREFDYSVVHRSRIVENVRKHYLIDLTVFTLHRGNTN